MLATMLMITVMSLSNPTGQVIKNGMVRAEVEQAWGPPTKRIEGTKAAKALFNIRESWVYESEHGTVTVFFHQTGGEPVVGQIHTARKYLRELEALRGQD